jgi:acyl-CoA synthetase (AMP-forming)/AMP-acid ligase II
MPAGSKIPKLLCYEDLLAAQTDDYVWPLFDENSAATLCYTSGTTGNPKGALYSHRSTVLHAYASALPNAQRLGARFGDARRTDVPRQRLGLAVFGAAVRRQNGVSPAPRWTANRCTS